MSMRQIQILILTIFVVVLFSVMVVAQQDRSCTYKITIKFNELQVVNAEEASTRSDPDGDGDRITFTYGIAPVIDANRVDVGTDCVHEIVWREDLHVNDLVHEGIQPFERFARKRS